MTQQITYQARTKEEFADLENRMKQFLANYIILGTNNIEVCNLVCSEKGTIKITPKTGEQIEQIARSASGRGYLLRSDPNFVVVELNKSSYFIKYTSDQA